MRKLVIAVAILALLGGSGSAAMAGEDAVTNGVGGAGEGAPNAASVVETAPDGVIDFDHVTAPCTFAEATALRRVGRVTFDGLTGPLDGAAIVNECGAFGVTGYSPPNFLAINCGAVLSDGGIPQLPEKITFRREVTGVSVNVGSGEDVGDTLTLVAKGSMGKERQRVTLAPTLQAVSFDDPVKKITIQAGTVCVMVLDDLTFS